MKKLLGFFTLAAISTIAIVLLINVKNSRSTAEAKIIVPENIQPVVKTHEIIPSTGIPHTNKAPAKTSIKKLDSAPDYLTAAEIRELVNNEIEELIKQGKINNTPNSTDLTFDKLSRLNDSYSEDKIGFQSIYIPVAAFDSGTFFSANNITADNINSANSANFNDITVNSLASLNGGLSLLTPTEGEIITTDSGAYLSSGGSWTNASSQDLKENFTPLNNEEILQKINDLNITQWNYKKESSSTYHIGPTAEDFYKTFSLGGLNGEKTISTIDPAGLALVGIQALTKKFVDLSWLVNSAKQFGITLEENIVKIKTLFSEIIYAENIEIGSDSLPTGITIYDKITKQPVCIEVKNSLMEVLPGKCTAAATATNTTTTLIQTHIELPSDTNYNPNTITPEINTSTPYSDNDQSNSPSTTTPNELNLSGITETTTIDTAHNETPT